MVLAHGATCHPVACRRGSGPPLHPPPPRTLGPSPHTRPGRPVPEHCKKSQGGWGEEGGRGRGGKGFGLREGPSNCNGGWGGDPPNRPTSGGSQVILLPANVAHSFWRHCAWVWRCLQGPDDSPYKSATKGLPLPVVRGVCETNSKSGRSRPRKPFISRVFCAQRGIETMVSEGARPRGRGRSGNCEERDSRIWNM